MAEDRPFKFVSLIIITETHLCEGGPTSEDPLAEGKLACQERAKPGRCAGDATGEGMKSDPAIISGSGPAAAAGRRMRGGLIWLAGAVALAHLGIALSMMANHVRRPEITAGSDAWHM